ncbi:TD and POZ domain-containing protein 5 [Araneus ventricosus]|uniref:TD and POZ domain-containing protein 5 n=1 Tax=Araneus ventricosus TaxID=182803 RepID=A0A4Y2L104_ARAVE|nr:TD and POZ domain-containing protein 5 [Araneus ventricosus]
MNDGMVEYTFTWFIENYSYCSLKNGENFWSPDFNADDLEGTVWCLRLCPRGLRDEDKGYLSLYLCRRDDDGPENFPLKYELSFLSADGATLRPQQLENTFKKGISYGNHQFLKMNGISLLEKSVYFPGDNLRLRCKIWIGGGNIHSVTEISARTRIGMEQISFRYVVEGFSALEPNQKKITRIRSSSKKGLALSCTLYFTDGPCCQGKIMVEIMPSGTDQVLYKCKLFLLDGSGKQIECGEANNRFDASRKDIQILPLSLLRQEILNRKREYLPDDKLSLSCECIFSTGVEYEKIEKTQYEKPFVALYQKNDNDQNSDTEKLSNSYSALDDFKEMYNNEFLTDMAIKTKTKSFPAHKIVLCARSPVFKAMMINDMKEKNSNIIQIDDLEDDIVQNLLLFLYSDNLETLQWESANKLYYAADKYAIEKLKVICSSFLIDNLSISTASELLLLGDTHNDSRLMKAVEDFISKHERQVYGSDEWKNLIETNPELVSKTMLLIHERKI